MVCLATAPPAPRQNLPLPATSQATMKITKSGWSTKPLTLPSRAGENPIERNAGP
jgi:hypothetical protein